MTINELKEKLETIPGSARIYTVDNAGWMTETADIILHFDEKLNQFWVELVEAEAWTNYKKQFIIIIEKRKGS